MQIFANANMGSVCSTLGAACRAIGDWLSAGLNWALSGVKWLWEKLSSLFETAMDFVTNLFSNVCGWFHYSRQRTYVESNGSRVEVGHEDLSIGVEVNRNRATSVPSVPANQSPQVQQENLGESTSVQSVPANQSPQVPQENLGEYLRNNVDDQQREQLALSRRLFDVLDDAVNNDEHHESMSESERKLGEFLQSPEMQRLQELTGMNTINPSLA
ncbi:uncharacterized protein [Montipora capricornis]|uniref:uncharacterized protein isoform X1 n=2 Tax=Montipora capricornis TaxID=246305 RepID=UPI0035F1D6DA